MSYGYGGRDPSFDQRDGATGAYSPLGGRDQSPAPYTGGNYGGNTMEMSSINTGSAFGGDPTAILNECRDIDNGIEQIEANLRELRRLQDRCLAEADSSASSSSRQLDALNTETMALYRTITDRVRKIKSSPEGRQPRNQAQVGRVDRRLRQAIQDYQGVESSFRKKMQDQMARQYRIVRPDATEDEVRAAVEDTTGNSQVFQQALMQNNRVGEARAVLSAVQDRHKALQRIEQQMVELAQLFEQLNTLIVEQDVKIQAIEQTSEEVVDNLDKGNEEIAVAVQTARATRKKKWMCLGICVAIIVVIVIIVVVYVVVTHPPGGGSKSEAKKRGLLQRSIIDDLQMNNARAIQIAAPMVGPISRIHGQSKYAGPDNADAESVAKRLSPEGLSRIISPYKQKQATTLAAKAKRFVITDEILEIMEQNNAVASRGSPRAGKRFVITDEILESMRGGQVAEHKQFVPGHHNDAKDGK
ncbi:putative snare protein [Sordaria brevicollis]|uniref:Snare protein n=1 Tax=Sordaria brevicollis TaxID=83679 RepID=A0AAE0P1X6_SORBR|nr:putative snare protein [Sordaria brevicollis]